VAPWQEALLAWYRKHARPLPWRGEKDPYRILVSEVLLQQTQVRQAIPYYRRFLQRFPTLKALGEAPLEEVLRAWQGAGYYRRAVHLHRLAQRVEALPQSFAQLKGLPGLGPYTAAAVASMAFGERVAAVDGNVRRVLARLFALEGASPKALQGLAQSLMPEEAHPGEWNQALMELGATVCLPRKPSAGLAPWPPAAGGRRPRSATPSRKGERSGKSAWRLWSSWGGRGFTWKGWKGASRGFTASPFSRPRSFP
jgi:A/G-specific adenine glycosylase